MSGESGLSKIGLAITTITAIIVVIVSIRSCQIAEQSSQLAEQTRQVLERSYEVLYRSNLPTISAISVFDYDLEAFDFTEKIMVYNVGGTMTNFSGSAYAIMEIEFPYINSKTYIRLPGYFLTGEYSRDVPGLLLTTYAENNLSDYWSIEGDFKDAALEDGYEPSVIRTLILYVKYYDYTGKNWSEYFDVSCSGNELLDESEAQEILDSVNEARELAESAGLSLHIRELEGRELWEWYKVAILEGFS